MRKITSFLFLTIVFSCSNVWAQDMPIKILILTPESEVISYYKTLINKFPDNNYLSIETKVTEDGNKFLSLSLPSDRDGKVDFIAVYSKFNRIDGKEICTKQVFAFENEDSYNTLAFIKDNFDFVSTNKWEYKINDDFKVEARFEATSENFCTITFQPKVIKK